YTLTHLVLGLAAVAVIATAIIVTTQRIGTEPAPAVNMDASANAVINAPVNRTIGTGDRCAPYTTPDGTVTYCATCGNGTCEEAEAGKSSACTRQAERVVCTADLGPLYCPQDCETDTANANISGNTNDQVYCTADAKECPDGSFVGRVGPDCEFAPCLGTSTNAAVSP
ncbi:MAG: hypothetical protein HY341_01785, partial [Candidatus Kerfeldbacteria bacterium]|nr:hypothetical protein [Candidatus Kerfeldbacteria bacterium]